MEHLQQVLPVGVVTLVFTDLVKSSEASIRHGAAFETVRNEHYRLLRAALAETNGFEIDTAGDALFAAFSEASAAIRFAIGAQQRMVSHDWEALLPGIGAVQVRIGMHTGEPFIGRDEKTGNPTYRGPVSNCAARVQSAAHGGQIVLSGATQALVSRVLPPDVTLLNCGTHRLKGVGEENLWQVCHPQLPSKFEALATLDPQRHNLPMPFSPLVGREREMSDWHEILCQPTTRLLTLWAFGGMGKTRAALQLAEICADEDTKGDDALFKNGVWWIELDQVTGAEAMIACIADGLGLQAQGNLTRKEQLWNFLRERQLLLVLDNTEQIAKAGAVIAELLQAAPGVKCLVTTRQALGVKAEVRREVSPLPTDEAIRLFVETVRRAGNAVEPGDPAVRELCRRLECVPLALELAASRAGALSPAEMVEQLDDQFRLLKSRAVDLKPRQRALRGAIDWSYDMLAPEDQKLFAELSVFSGGFTLLDADAVAEEGDAFDGVMELHRCSLLRAVTDSRTQRTRYFMLESLRAYATEKLSASPEIEHKTRQRHAKHFTGMLAKYAAQLRSSGEVAALTDAAPHLDNARSALRFALDAQDYDLAARMALSLGRMLQSYGSFREAAVRLQTGFDAVEKAPNSEAALRARLNYQRAFAHYDAFNWEAAAHLAEAALALFEECGDVCGQADAWNLRGLISMKTEDDFALIQERFSRAMTLFGQGSYPIGVALVRCNQGLAEREAGHHAIARSHFEAALAVYREEGYQRGIAEALTNLGVLAQEDLKDRDQAWNYYHAALEIELVLQNQFGTARALYNLGEIAAERGEHLQQIHEFGAARALYNLGEVASDRGQHAEAVRLFTAAENLFERCGSPYSKVAAEGRDGILSALPSEVNFAAGLPAVRASLKEKPLREVAQWATDG